MSAVLDLYFFRNQIRGGEYVSFLMLMTLMMVMNNKTMMMLTELVVKKALTRKANSSAQLPMGEAVGRD